jgi:ubiquinone/menaquinone biosynthesis C-methylase UbiE
MEEHLIQIREQQKEIWNRFSPGWKKWDELTMNFLKPMGDEMISLLNPQNADLVLDVASGTGEPGLTIASKLNGGVVVITDVSDGMLNVARGNAERRAIKNVRFTVTDVTELPFDDESFDLISCRFGFMFFPDMLMAAREMFRVLKPGGKLAAAVWNAPEKNFWATATLASIKRYLNPEPVPKGAPGLFRCAEDGLMADLIHQAGFKNITEKDIDLKLNARSTETYWSFMTEVVAPVVAALSKADDAGKERIRKDVFESVEEKFPLGRVAIDASALVISGQK